MILLSPAMFWTVVILGLIFGLLALFYHFKIKRTKNPTEQQTRHNRRLFNLFFLGFLIFGFTPILITLMLLPV